DAAVEWFPFGREKTIGYLGGGGEHPGKMQAAERRPTPGANQQHGQRLLARLNHISYFNQWQQAWVGFHIGDERFVGLFTGWGSLWKRRGRVRPELMEDDERGHFLRFPLRRGRRVYGIVLSTQEQAGVDDPSTRCLLNRRKTQLADLSPAKIRNWAFDIPLAPRSLRLVREDDLNDLSDRLPDPAAPDHWEHPAHLVCALARNDEEALRQHGRQLSDLLDRSRQNAIDGGYNCVIIFDGRRAKSLAYNLDLLWFKNLIDERDYRRARSALLMLAYIFADPDYCNYGDFWPQHEPEEGIAEALENEMGDCPVPPNFASEFFSTTGLVAELFPHHPLADEWRQWAAEQTDAFLDTFFETDGTYHESINYHAHAITEMLAHFYPLRLHGGRDYFSHPAVRGSFVHFVQLQMPRLESVGHAPLPGNGNSGSHGKPQEYRGELTVAASVLKHSDPELAGQLMHAWRIGGRPVQDQEHPLLTAATLDESIPSVAPAWQSVHRHGLGIVSKATKADGAPVWALFRAGSATHHMDFDQGHIHLAAWDTELLGDHGYHTEDSEGNPIPAFTTWLHSTVTYARDRNLACGYTGIEKAPSPLLVHLGADFDWCVHRIVNNNYRDPSQFTYLDMLPAPETVHYRHYLFVKPDYFVLWDTFERLDGPATFRLHPTMPVVQTSGTSFRAGEAGKPHLLIDFAQP
ncbi:MAG: hypothetical protein QF473_38585, partial [Planctomycetota bacterium]|nr:hypothetical protein [Planctomycetota bacterium]